MDAVARAVVDLDPGAVLPVPGRHPHVVVDPVVRDLVVVAPDQDAKAPESSLDVMLIIRLLTSLL